MPRPVPETDVTHKFRTDDLGVSDTHDVPVNANAESHSRQSGQTAEDKSVVMPTLMGRHIIQLHFTKRSYYAELNAVSIVTPVGCASPRTGCENTGSSVAMQITMHWPHVLNPILGRLIAAQRQNMVPELTLIITPVGCASSHTGQSNTGSSVTSLLTIAASAARAAAPFPTRTMQVAMHWPEIPELWS